MSGKIETLPSGEEEEEQQKTTTNKNEDVSMTEPHSPTDSSDSDSDSDAEAESEAKAQIEALETALSQNPLDYDSNVQYIKLLRKQGDIEKLGRAREAMSLLFPLVPEMWREWARDEITMNSGLEAFHAVEKIYERGVSDYLSVTLWCDYLNFVEEHDQSVRECSPAGISKMRNLFERALTAAGLHVAEGQKIWELYREFEQAILLTIEETDHGSKEKQIQKIRSLFHRQLSVPLVDLESTLLAYKAWEADLGSAVDSNSSEMDGLSRPLISAYQKALEMLNARVHLEEKVSKKDVGPEKFQEFMTYLKFEHSSGDPARIQILYERAIAEFPVSSDLWLDYTGYLDKTFKTAKLVRDGYYRATRNCPWVGELWVHYLLSLERGHSSDEEISTVFEKSLVCTFSSFDEYLNIFLTRVDGLRRRLSASKQAEDSMNYAVIRDVFERASDYLSPHLMNTESLFHMHSYWARLELKLGKNIIAARGVWESLLKTSGSMLEAWQGYISMEIEMDHIKEARSLYKRCYSKKFPGTGSEDICHSWVRFEKEHGSLEEFDVAVQKVTPRLQELQLFRLQQESTNIGVATDERDNSSKKISREKRKPSSSSVDEQSPNKRAKTMSKNSKKANVTDKVEESRSVEASKAAAELQKSETVSDSSKDTKDKSFKRPVSFDDQCTVFISNLNFQTKDSDLEKFFADVGGLVAIRILKDKITRKSRGLAYVDFSDDAHLAAAVEKNKQILLGKRLSILKSDPQRGGKQKAPGRGSKPEHGKTDPQETSKGRTESQSQSIITSGHEDVHLKGRNTFAVPRNVKALGWSTTTTTTNRSKPQSEGGKVAVEDENPKSNDEFRKMFLKP